MRASRPASVHRGRSSRALLALATLLAACSNSSGAPASTTVAPTTTTAGGATTSGAPASSAATTVAGTDVAPTSSTTPPHRWSATITRTTYGIPHVVADDWGSLGFGQGYAFAQDRACTLIDQVIKVRGERAKWFGAGNDDANVNSDVAYRALGLHDSADQKFADQPARIVAMVTGYVAGFDAELSSEGPHGWCTGQPWVQPITTTDLYAYLNDVVLFASSGVLLGPIATAQPPGATGATTTAPAGTTPGTTAAPATTAANPIDSAPETVPGETTSVDAAPGDTASADAAPVTMPDLHSDLASNGWAIGSDLSESGEGMLLANPHFPWEGEKRLWESQLTLTTGELDVYGATLSGVPGVLIGFNHDVAWTHTVSAGYRMTLYQLNLVPGDPTSYVYGGGTRHMTSKDVSIDVKQPDGSTSQVTRTMWSSHYGPMLNLPFGWTDTTAYTYRDANLDDTGVLQQWLGMDSATSLDAFIGVHRDVNAVPWVNTVAVSADGRAWYGDTSSTPNLSADAIANWQAQVKSGGLAKTVLDNGAILLDGSNPANEWQIDPKAVRPGLLPFTRQPQLTRTDFVFNSNDSHWLANPRAPLTGFSPLTGPEGLPQTPRTRMNAVLLTDPAVRGKGGKFSLDEVQQAIFSNRTITSELLRKQVVKTCRRTPLVLVDDVPFDLKPACDVLDAWNGRDDVDAKGAALWREYMTMFSRADRTDKGALFSVGFSKADPIATPNTFNDASDQKVLSPLGQAAKALTTAGFAIDAPLGDLQFDARAQAAGTPRLALPGGTNVEGAASIVDCCSGSNTLAPRGDSGTRVAGHGLTSLGYPVQNGDSFVMTLEFTKDGPKAAAVLTYGQPDDPANPDYRSQTELFARGTFRPVAYTADDVAAAAVAAPVTVTGDPS